MREIDELGLSKALRLAVKRAVGGVRESFHEIVIDGTVNFLSGTKLEKYVTVLAKADALIPEVSAASIVAKVARDDYMRKVGERWPGYGFERHVGYGTGEHLEALKRYGVTEEHRMSFRPVSEAAETSGSLPPSALSRARLSLQGAGAAVRLKVGVSNPSFTSARRAKSLRSPTTLAGNKAKASALTVKSTEVCPTPTTTQIGNRAENAMTEYLEGRGHEVVGRNWKTSFCEIDIVSRCGEFVYFTEVKYRYDEKRGSGVEAVTKKKVQRMRFAAESYMKWSGLDESPVLAVGAVSGAEFEVDDWFTI